MYLVFGDCHSVTYNQFCVTRNTLATFTKFAQPTDTHTANSKDFISFCHFIEIELKYSERQLFFFRCCCYLY